MIKSIHRVAILGFIFLCLNWGDPAQAQENLSSGTLQDTDSTMQQSLKFGYLKIVTNVDSVFARIDRNFKTCRKMRSGDSLRLTVGEYKFVVSTKLAHDHYFNIEIAPDTTLIYRIDLKSAKSYQTYIQNSAYPRFYWNANLLILTDNDSEVFIGNKRFGRGEVKIDTLAGAYEITTRHRYAGTTHKKVKLYATRLEVAEMYNKPLRASAYSLAILPGAKQFYQNEKLKGIAIFGLFATGAILSYNHHREFRKENQAYLSARYRYLHARSEDEAIKFAPEAQTRFDQTKLIANWRNAFVCATAGIYVLNLFDALSSPRGGYRDMKRYRARVVPFSVKEMPGLHLSFHF